MKNRILFTIVLIILVISEISMVYADVIIPGKQFHSYGISGKLEKFNEYLQSPLKEFIAILIILFIVIGLVLLTFRIVNDKKQNKSEEKSNSMIILQNSFLGISLVLSLFSIYMVKLIKLFDISYNAGIYADKLAEMAHSFMISLYIIYTIIIFIFSIISIKKKNKKIICTTVICLTIVILLICFITYSNASIGYYTYDKESLSSINPRTIS